MNLAILLVEGADKALQKLRDALDLEVEKSWKKGDARRIGFHASSGFSAMIADADNPGQMILAIRAFLTECANSDVTFLAGDLSACLSVGITVGDSRQFVASVDFSAEDLKLMGSLGIAVSVTAYPTSDEANEDDSCETV